MLNARRWMMVLAAASFVAFAYGAIRLYLLHFSAGDVYTPYSTLRADPVGAKALYQALGSIPELRVERNLRPLSSESLKKAVGNREVTLFLLGADASDPDHAPLDFVRAVEHVMAIGGRVVVTFAPTWEDLRAAYDESEFRKERIERMRKRRMGEGEDEPTENREEDAKDSSGAPIQQAEAEEPEDNAQEESPEAPEDGKESAKTQDAEEDSDDKDPDDASDSRYEILYATVEIQERWGVRLAFDTMERRPDGTMEAQWAEWKSIPGLPSRVSWRTATSFSHLSDAWSVIYERDGKPVLVERPFGDGTLVLAADSYFVSNEALKNERHPELLSWLVGPHLTVIFDESHLGITRNAGIMTLVRGYGLYAAFLGLVLLALLYIWKNAFSFVPPYEDEMQADARHAVGKDSAAGFTNLLRRSILPRDLLSACLAEYRRSLGFREKDMAEPLNRMQALADAERVKPAGSWNPADAYAAMSRVLSEYLGRTN